ncbi:O-antigen ligase family protein [Methylocapsa palsarum]|uniref:O-Antigen ligase n=1 Tax=Methylocapsa palsarum TaxID=1612308 RepID=A0A1I4C0R7_9HYPH|nr:O-antigen ligase family protein [Methylocapsa palsarum]SFK74668.1 O-Antigen ligase [Methylocapsa palsarum]
MRNDAPALGQSANPRQTAFGALSRDQISEAQARPRSAFAKLRLRARDLGRLRGAELYDGFLRFIPILWGLGALTPAGALMLVKLAAERWPRGVLINIIVFSWIFIGVSQACAAILNGIAIRDYAKGFGNAFGFGVVGWIFGALAIAAGAAHRLDGPRTVRAVTWVGGYIILLGALAAVGRLAGLQNFQLWPTPVGMILPKSPSVSFYTVTTIFQTEETLGELSTRLLLFFPWTTGLGLGGLAIAFISFLEGSLKWRFIGVAGGVVAVVFSWSRIAIVSMLVIALILAFFRAPFRWRLGITGVVLTTYFFAAMQGFDPIDAVKKAQDGVNGARAGSSLARELIYTKSWEGFLKSPIIGNGWIGDSVHNKETLPIGSHSTIYGLAYTGGAPTLAAFVFAMTLTFVALIWRFLSYDFDDPRRSGALVAIGLILCLLSYCRYEALFNLTLPCLFLFTWLGATLSAERPERARAAAGGANFPATLGARGTRAFAFSPGAARPVAFQKTRSYRDWKNDE